MKKWYWPIGAGVILFALGLVIWATRACDARANQCISDLTASGMTNKSVPTLEAIQSCREFQSYFCRVVSSANIVNLGLFCVGLLAVLAGLLTLGAIRRQSDAMINSERAWLIAELVPICRQFGGHWCRPSGNGGWVEMSGEEIAAGHYLRHLLKVTNMGRTPATIVGFEYDYSFPIESPEPMMGGDVKTFKAPGFDKILPGDESYDLTEVDIREIQKTLYKSEGDYKRLVLFEGGVKYRHVFDDSLTQDARFRYVYSPVGKIVGRLSLAKTPKKKR